MNDVLVSTRQDRGFPNIVPESLAPSALTQNLRRNSYVSYVALDAKSIKMGAPPTMSFDVLILDNHGILRDVLSHIVRGLYEG
jgi:hypothetical protein